MLRRCCVFLSQTPLLSLFFFFFFFNDTATTEIYTLSLHDALPISVGTLVKFGADLAIGATNTFAELVTLTSDMAAGRVALLFVHGTNPAHSLPGAFQQALGKAGYKVSFSSYLDETAAACDLILPDHHPLEQWGDSRPRVGVAALQQPVVQPVFDTRPAGDLILKLAGKGGTFQDYLQGKLRARHSAGFEQYWLDSLAKGGIYGEAPTRAVRLAKD